MEHEMRSLWSQMLRRWQGAGVDRVEARLREDAALGRHVLAAALAAGRRPPALRRDAALVARR
jgi:hypothetical protein